MLPPTPVRSYFKPREGPHRFTHHPQPPRPEGRDSPLAGLFSVALVVIRQDEQQLNANRFSPDAQPLAGSLPYSVRTFLSFNPERFEAATARPALLQGSWIIANHCSTRTAQKINRR